MEKKKLGGRLNKPYQTCAKCIQEGKTQPSNFPCEHQGGNKSFKVTLKYGDMVQEQETDTILKALENISPEFKVKAGKIKLIVETEDQRADLILTTFQIKRLLMNDIARKLTEKRIKMFLKEKHKVKDDLL